MNGQSNGGGDSWQRIERIEGAIQGLINVALEQQKTAQGLLNIIIESRAEIQELLALQKAATVGIASILVNTFWLRYALDKIGSRVTELKEDFGKRFDRVDGDLKDFNVHLKTIENDSTRLKERTGLPE